MVNAKSALAIAAHPDDIEFGMAGTLLLLREAGWQIHYLNLATGNCGSNRHSSSETIKRRGKESRAAARVLGARYHPPFLNDLEIFYADRPLRKLAAIVRAVQPSLVLTHSPEDYMEDHTNTCRLAVTAAFARGMPNYRTLPSRPAFDHEVTVYHAMPHGLCDGLRRRVVPEIFVDTSTVQPQKLAALACHQSQQDWLDTSQGMNSYLQTMEELSAAIGSMSKRFRHAEGWRRHSHLGFCAPDADPLTATLKDRAYINRAYRV